MQLFSQNLNLQGKNALLPPMILRSSSFVAPSLFHRLSIVSPSFRWSNDGVLMEYPPFCIGGAWLRELSDK